MLYKQRVKRCIDIKTVKFLENKASYVSEESDLCFSSEKLC